jgi:hypothetical protein
VLGKAQALLGGPAHPGEAFGGVLILAKHVGEAELPMRIALFGERAIELHGFVELARMLQGRGGFQSALVRAWPHVRSAFGRRTVIRGRNAALSRRLLVAKKAGNMKGMAAIPRPL